MGSYQVWSKFEAGLTAEVLGDPDEAGFAPAYLRPYEGVPFTGAVKLNEWSLRETAPVPGTVPDVGYLVMYGDPDHVSYLFVPTEEQALKELSVGNNAFGYTPVSIYRNAMVSSAS